MSESGAPETFLEEVIAAAPGGQRLRHCLQCGVCGGSCPNGADMDRSPRGLFALVFAGERERVLSSNTMWLCVSCYLCTVRCPKEIPITDIMYGLKRMSVAEHPPAGRDAIALARSFTFFIEKYGRSFEFGLASRYYLSRKPVALLGLGPLGLRMFSRGRLNLKPSKIREIDQLRTILETARELGGEA